MEMEKRTIIEFLRSQEVEIEPEMMSWSMMDLIDFMIDQFAEQELDYQILSTAYASGVHPSRYEDFHEAVLEQYESIEDGQEVPTPVLDRLAGQYR